MAAEVTLTEENNIGVVRKIKWEWVAHTDGAVAVDTPNAQTANAYNGKIEGLATVPGAGADAPDDNYTVRIYDEDSLDVLFGAAAGNRDTANTEQILASSLGIVVTDKLSLYVEGAGSGNKGTVYLYIR
jgi:hypothetical protein